MANDSEDALSATSPDTAAAGSPNDVKQPPGATTTMTTNITKTNDSCDDQPTPTLATSLPTYASVQSSDDYARAKKFMQEGDFEQALSRVEYVMELVHTTLTTQFGLTEEQASVHLSRAPLHYLYGTTLLYSIEEAKDDEQNAGAGGPSMVNMPTTTVAAAVAEGEDKAPEEQGEDKAQAEAESPSGEAENAPAAAEDTTEDLQIAYENLDLARHLLETHLETMEKDEKDQKKEDSGGKEEYSHLKLDLAQIYLREGDLQRLNGHYGSAANDYQCCLTLRQEGLTSDASEDDDSNATKYHRKLADAHYNLALTYSLWVVSSKEQDQTQQPQQPDGSDAPPPPTPQELEMYRQKSLEHYLACAEIFGAQMVILTGAVDDVPAFLHDAQTNLPGKTTGDADVEPSVRAAQQLKHLMDKIAQLPAPLDDQFHQYSELLQEIYEAVAEAKHSEEGYEQVQGLRSQITAAAAAQADAAAQQEEEEGAGETASAPAFGSAEAATVSANANTTMMVVRKKKKRPLENQNVEQAPTKKPAPSE